jgi:hypothetical protein
METGTGMIPFITIVDLQREARLNSPSGVSSPAAARALVKRLEAMNVRNLPLEVDALRDAIDAIDREYNTLLQSLSRAA